MRLVLKLVTLAASTTLLAAAASADTFYSDASMTSYVGYSTSATGPFTGTSTATYNIPTGGVWTAPVGSSSWVSFSPTSYPGGPTPYAPNGYYEYSTSVTGVAGALGGSLTVMADDTVSVFLNGIKIVDQYNGSSFPKCAAGTPNCIVPTTVSFSGLNVGANTFTFVVDQAASKSTGLDYSGTTVTPEPSSLLLLGTGLVGSAGAMLRRFRRA